ncbi:MAG: hypothetical protein WAW00_02125 [Candidatus Moraniibacteriota bacterium]
MFKNIFRKSKQDSERSDDFSSIPGAPKMEDMNMFQRFAMRRLMKMSPADREKALKKSLTPKNIQKNKGEILSSLEAMRKVGQISDDQYRLTKAKLGLK